MKTGRQAFEIDKDEFKAIGYELVDKIAAFYDDIRDIPLTTAMRPSEIKGLLPTDGLPKQGQNEAGLVSETFDLMRQHSLFLGHPRFWGFICGSGAPIGTFADFMASAINPNVGGYVLSPVATEIESQVISWLCELVGYPKSAGGLIVSGGNMANFHALLAARTKKAQWDIRQTGLNGKGHKAMTIYTSDQTHTWIHKAADLFGFGTDAIRWIDSDANQRIDMRILEDQIINDIEAGYHPFAIIGNAGTVSTGAIDPMDLLRRLCDKYQMWLHADGAYGGVAACLPDAPDDLKSIKLADSIAIDPHKWLYASVEAGCILVKEPQHLKDTFSYKPVYYKQREENEDLPIDFYEYGLQNSRGFKALKVWMALKQVGKDNYVRSIHEDIELAIRTKRILDAQPEFEVHDRNLSILTFRFVPSNWQKKADKEHELNKLNEALVVAIQSSGKLFLSNAVIDGKFMLRMCIVNHRTTQVDVEALPALVSEIARDLLD